MKTKHLLYLTLLLCSILLAYTSTADAQKVHACLILLGNDRDPTFRASVDINQEAMIGLMEIVSRNVEVHMTLMKSEPGRRGEVRNTHLVNTEIRDEDFPKQLGIIKPDQVTEWIQTQDVGPSDTIFVYFNGHGKVDRYGTHQLQFDKTKRLARDIVLEALREKPGRLKMLITDTCSEVQKTAHPAAGNLLAQYGDTEAKPQFYAQHLFLEHTGILDITATSPEIRTASDTDKAFGDTQVGGFFTYALTNALVPTADTNRDDFLSWKEAFAATKEGTKRLCESHPLVKSLNIIQRPVAHTLPKRIGGGSSSRSTQPPVITPSTIAQNGAKFDDTLLQGHTDTVYSVAFSPDGKTIASGSFDDTIRLWDAKTGKLIRTLNGTHRVSSISFSPDGKTIVSGGVGFDDTIRLWDAKTGKLIRTLNETDIVSSVAFSPDGKTIASASLAASVDGDHRIRLWDAKTGKLIRTLTGHTDTVSSVAFSPDGRTIASGSSDNTIRLWEVSTGKLMRTLKEHTVRVYSVSFSPDGKTIASGGSDDIGRLWKLAD